MRRRAIRSLFVLSGLLPILALLNPQPDPTPLIYSIFVLTYVIRRRSASISEEARASTWSFGLAIVGYGNFVKCAPQPALMHPQLLPDLALGIAFYGGWAIAWVVLLRYFSFSLRQVFCAQGAFGVLIEQRGAIFLSGLAVMPFGLVLWTYVFLVYGSVVGIADRSRGDAIPLAAINRGASIVEKRFALRANGELICPDEASTVIRSCEQAWASLGDDRRWTIN